MPSNLALALLSNGSGDNGNGTLTTVIAATVTDTNGNPVPDASNVFFNISGATNGAVVNSPSGTNSAPPCDVTNFETRHRGERPESVGRRAHLRDLPDRIGGRADHLERFVRAANDSQTFNLPAPPGP